MEQDFEDFWNAALASPDQVFKMTMPGMIYDLLSDHPKGVLEALRDALKFYLVAKKLQERGSRLMIRDEQGDEQEFVLP